MCGRYYLADFTEEEAKEYYDILNDLDKKIKSPGYDIKVKTSGEIFPTDIVPIIANNKDQEIKAFAMEWGFAPFQEKGRPIINARSETASEKQTFKKSMIERRCLIPAAYYYEWEKQSSGKIKHEIHPVGQSAFFMAGLYRMESDKQTPVFTILTRDAAPGIRFIHDRMPVILPEGARNDWLNLKYDADEIIQAALLDMQYKPA